MDMAHKQPPYPPSYEGPPQQPHPQQGYPPQQCLEQPCPQQPFLQQPSPQQPYPQQPYVQQDYDPQPCEQLVEEVHTTIVVTPQGAIRPHYCLALSCFVVLCDCPMGIIAFIFSSKRRRSCRNFSRIRNHTCTRSQRLSFWLLLRHEWKKKLRRYAFQFLYVKVCLKYHSSFKCTNSVLLHSSNSPNEFGDVLL